MYGICYQISVQQFRYPPIHNVQFRSVFIISVYMTDFVHTHHMSKFIHRTAMLNRFNICFETVRCPKSQQMQLAHSRHYMTTSVHRLAVCILMTLLLLTDLQSMFAEMLEEEEFELLLPISSSRTVSVCVPKYVNQG